MKLIRKMTREEMLEEYAEDICKELPVLPKRMSKSWYSNVQDLEYKDGHKEKEYRIVFETTDTILAKRVEKYLQSIMDDSIIKKSEVSE